MLSVQNNHTDDKIVWEPPYKVKHKDRVPASQIQSLPEAIDILLEMEENWTKEGNKCLDGA